MIASLRHPNIVLFMGETLLCKQSATLNVRILAAGPDAVSLPADFVA